MTHSEDQNVNQESTSRTRSRVYFIEAVGLDLIKIGYTSDLTERLRKLAPGCPAPLRLLGTVPGGLEIERHYHERLAAYRSRGEWFRRSPALDAIVSGLDQPEPPPQKPDPQAAKMNAYYEANADRLFREWADKKKAKAASRAQRTLAADEIAARL